MILFRADSNKEIGQGHVMRCLSVADAFREKKTECKFICAANSNTQLIEERGYEVISLSTLHDEMEKEVVEVREILDMYKPETFIIDSYHVTAEYLSAVRDKVRTVYFDDVYSFAYPVDVLVNYNIYGPDIDYGAIYEKAGILMPQMILGTEYAPLREMFCNVPLREQKAEVKDVLVSTGGSDPLHIALQLAEKTAKSEEEKTYHFLIGTMNADYEKIISVAEQSERIIVHYNVPDMKILIQSCDVALSAAGSTMYEICACGVPMITYAFADNQLPGAEAFNRNGLALSCGDLRKSEAPAEELLCAINALSKDYERRCLQGEKMQEMIDGNGAVRLAGRIREMIHSGD